MKAPRRFILSLVCATTLTALCAALPADALASADAVAVGGDGTCATVAVGGINCWGVPAGYADADESLKRMIADDVPSPLRGIDDIATDVALTDDHGCAVVEGAAYCWGSNGVGQLGDGSTDDSDVPVPVQGLSSDVQDIAVSEGQTCAIHAGAVSCWGTRHNGFLGTTTTGAALTPAAVAGLESGVSSLDIGSEVACAVAAAKALCWGLAASPIGRSGVTGVVPPGVAAGLTDGVESVSVDEETACAIVDASARCWGEGDQGQLGDGTTADSFTVAREVSGLTAGVTAITVGYRIACAAVSGAARCWGANLRGLFGDGSFNSNVNQPSTPASVTGMTSGVDAVSADADHVCARQSGGIKCWGAGHLGALGNAPPLRSTTPVAVAGGESISHLAVGESAACGVNSGAATCWGNLDDSHWIQSILPKPLGAPMDDAVTALSIGYSRACGIVGGAVKCDGGEVGGIEGLETGATAVSSHDLHACGSTSNVVRCFGDDYGTSGPITIDGVGSPVTALASGFRFDCALVGGAARCWGENTRHQLGVAESPVGLRTPVTPSGLTSGVTAIAAGWDFACAVVSGAAKCWGEGVGGQLGNGSFADRQVPTQVSGLTSGVASVSASSHHACALTTAGAVYCWGENDSGQLGSGDFEESSVPVLVQGASVDVTEVSAGDQTTCAKVAGTAKCWGSNKGGMLGAGTAFWKLTPVATGDAASAKPFVAILSPQWDSIHASHEVSFDVFSDTSETVLCKVDGRPYVPCSDTISDLEDGEHAVRAKVTDIDGQAATDLVYFVVDTTAPELEITEPFDDFDAVGDRWFQIAFSSTEQLESAECSVDGGEPFECLGYYTRRFEQGLHTVSVTGTDFAGNSGTSTKSFRVGPAPVTLPPVGSQPGPVNSGGLSARYSFTGSYRAGNRTMTVRIRLRIPDPRVPGRCGGSISIAASKIGGPSRLAQLRVDRADQCTTRLAYRLRRSLRGKRSQLTFTFSGNGYYKPVGRRDSKKL